VIFICQDEDHCRQFLSAADRELTGHLWHPNVGWERCEYVGRRRLVFAIEPDMHSGLARAWRVPRFPRSRYYEGEDDRSERAARCVRLPGHGESDGAT
jgi:hypothetical protein